MARKRQTAVSERGIFTDDVRPAIHGVFQTEEQFLDGVRRDVNARRSGKRVKPIATVSFESVAALLRVLTPRRYALIEAVKERGSFDSIEQLAEAVERDRAAVSRDLKALTEAGLLQMHEAVLPGHGRRAEITPVARRLTVELAL